MIFAFIIALIFGVAQVFLLYLLTGYATSGKYAKAAGIFSIKFVSYGIALALLVFEFMSSLTACLCGFAVGMPLTAILLYIYKAFFPGKISEMYQYYKRKRNMKKRYRR